MKWYQTILLGIYSVTALYLLYKGSLHVFVYFANKSLGHQESFVPAAWHLVIGSIFLLFSVLAWHVFRQPATSKIWSAIVYLPISVLLAYVLWMVLILISSGGKWN